MATSINPNEEWESDLLYWSRAVKPGYKYSEKRKAWWKDKSAAKNEELANVDQPTLTQTMHEVEYIDFLTFTSLCNVYKSRNKNFDSTILEVGERSIYSVKTTNYQGFLIIAFENGKIAKVAMESYRTEYNRKKLLNAFNDESKLIFIQCFDENIDLVAIGSNGKILIFDTAHISCVNSRVTKGIQVMKLKDGSSLCKVKKLNQVKIENAGYYRKNLNSVGYYLKPYDNI